MSIHRDTGVPRNSPNLQPLVPSHLAILKHSSPTSRNNSAIPGEPGGVLDLSSIQKVTGTNRAGMFVSTAVTGEGSHLHQQQRNTNNNNNRDSSASPFCSSASRIRNSKPSREDKYERQQQLLSERSPIVSTRVDIREQPDLQMRFAASVLPSGRRSVQPLPEFLDSSFGFRATLQIPSCSSSSPPSSSQHPQEHLQQNFLSTSSPIAAQDFHYHHQRQDHHHHHRQEAEPDLGHDISTSSSIRPDEDAGTEKTLMFSVSPVPKIQNQHRQHQTVPTTTTATTTPIPVFSSSSRSNLDISQRPHSSSRGGSGRKSRTSATTFPRQHSANRSTSNTKNRTRRASRVVCCPEEHATAGHLANGIVIGTCEKQAMERYLQVARELELEQEARATDKWKAELALVKSLNKIQDLEKQVEKLTEIVENPRPLHEAKLLRQEFEDRWKQAQLRVEVLEKERVHYKSEEDEIRRQLMQKEHECEGLKAAVRRMEKTDHDHEEMLAQWRMKWFDEKAEKEKAEAAIRELNKHIGKVTYENKSLRAAIRGLEQRLIVSARHQDKRAGNKPSPVPAGELLLASSPQGAARNVANVKSNNNSINNSVQLHDLDAAVRVLMHAYSSPGSSPLRAHHPSRSSPARQLNSSGILSYMSAKGEEHLRPNTTASPRPSGLDNLMFRTSAQQPVT